MPSALPQILSPTLVNTAGHRTLSIGPGVECLWKGEGKAWQPAPICRGESTCSWLLFLDSARAQGQPSCLEHESMEQCLLSCSVLHALAACCLTSGMRPIGQRAQGTSAISSGHRASPFIGLMRPQLAGDPEPGAEC